MDSHSSSIVVCIRLHMAGTGLTEGVKTSLRTAVEVGVLFIYLFIYLLLSLYMGHYERLRSRLLQLPNQTCALRLAFGRAHLRNKDLSQSRNFVGLGHYDWFPVGSHCEGHSYCVLDYSMLFTFL